jgi:hypothetical protein
MALPLALPLPLPLLVVVQLLPLARPVSSRRPVAA